MKLDNNSLPAILLVEDDPVNAQTIGRFLRNSYKVENVTNGQDAINIAKRNSFDVILMDIGLKGKIDGLEAAREIKKMENHKNTPIVAITAYVLPGIEEKFLSEGCTHYLPKPFTRDELNSLLTEILVTYN
ncbi:signal transduction histidine-protein kinase BarA [bacterium BMS3Abin03]|nr:signal transduction histidine-protein kinase BarA [bacterium BMS3Abin03]